MDKKTALPVLTEAYQLLLSIGVESWLTDGTLLGFYREGDFIGHDGDVDLGVNAKSWKESILPLMKSNGFEVIRIEGIVENGLEYSFKKNGVSIDFFFFYERDDQIWHSAWLKGIQLKFAYPKFNTKPVEFLGESFRAPENEEEYLRIKYGKEWNIPQAKWHWAFSPKNVELGMPTLNNRLRFIHQWFKWKVRIFKKKYRSFFSQKK